MCGMVTSKNASKAIWTTVLVLLVVLAAYAVLAATEKVVISDSSVKVSGVYGTEVRFADVSSMEELGSLPIGVRTNGIGLGFVNVGHFSYEGIGKVVLYQVKTDRPFLLVTTKDLKVIYGFGKDTNAAIEMKIRAELEARKRP